MAFLPTNASQIQQFAVALYGIQVGTNTMAAVQADITSVGSLNAALNNYYSVSFGSLSTTAVANSVVANLGLTGAAATSGAAYIVAALNAAPAANRGAVMQGILNLFSSLPSTDTTYGAAAAAWNTKIASAVSYTGAADAAAGSTVGVGTSFTLDTTVQSLTGTSQADTFTGVFGGTDTINVGDTINGGAGADVLNILVATAGGTLPIISLSNVETVDLRLLGDATFNQITSAGVETISVAGNSLADKGLTVTNADIATKFAVNGEQDLTVRYLDAASGVAKLALNHAGSAGNLSAVDFGTAVGSVDITATGTSYASLTVTGGLAVAASGAGALNLTLNAGVSALNAANVAGSGTYTFATGAAVTVTGGANNDTFDFGAAGGLTSADTINGGGGVDTVKATLNGAYVTTGTITNVEKMELTATNALSNTVDASASTINDFTLRGTGSFSLRNLVASTVNLSDDALTGVSADMANAALTIRGGSASAGSMDFGSLTVSDATTLTLTAVGTGAATFDFGDVNAKATTININAAGNGSINVDSLVASATTALTITTAGSAAYTGTGTLAQASSLNSLTLSAGSEGADLTFGDTSRVGGTTAVSSQGFALNISGTNGGDVTFGGVSLAASVAAGALTINAGASSTITFGTSINGADNASIAAVNVTAGSDAVVTLDDIVITGATGASVGQVTVNQGASSTVTLGALTVSNIAGITASGAAKSTYVQGALTGSSIGNISVAAGTASLGAITATGTIGSIAFTGSSLSAADISGSAIGNLTIAAAGTATLAGIESDGDQTNVGDIRFDGGILTISNIGTGSNGGATGAVGNIAVSASNLVDIDAIDAGEVGNIVVTGSGSFALGSVDSDHFVSFDASGVKGSAATTVSASFANVTSNISITLGASSTNVIVSGQGDDEFMLAAATASDTIIFTADGQGKDYIRRFAAGTAQDTLSISAAATATDGIKLMSFDNGGTALNVNAATGITSHLQFTAGAISTASIGTADYVVISGTSFADANSMIAALATGGMMALTSAGTGQAAALGTGSNLLVIWTDGQNGHATLVDLTLTGTGSIVDLASTGTFVTLADLDGFTQAKLVNWADSNIDFDKLA